MNTVADMRGSVFFEGDDAARKVSRFWILLTLAAVIAGAGVVADSTATVIGAMIVAPLMTPILGVVLATVLGDRENVVRSWAFVLGGAVLAVVIGYAIGLLAPVPVIAESNSQVAGRTSPHLIDLLAAVATGVVGAIALVRRDISDTLPGVAIAISLVPPLSVVGLTLESQAWDQSLGALLLFVTNVAAILATGVIVLLAYRVGADSAAAPDASRSPRRLRPLVTILVGVVIIGVPLTASSVRIASLSGFEATVSRATAEWAAEEGWDIAGTRLVADVLEVSLTGAPPVPPTTELRSALAAAGVDLARVRLVLVPAYTVELGDAP